MFKKVTRQTYHLWTHLQIFQQTLFIKDASESTFPTFPTILGKPKEFLIPFQPFLLKMGQAKWELMLKNNKLWLPGESNNMDQLFMA